MFYKILYEIKVIVNYHIIALKTRESIKESVEEIEIMIVGSVDIGQGQQFAIVLNGVYDKKTQRSVPAD